MAINRLKNHTFYLVGPIDCDPTLGKGWRDNMTVFLDGLSANTIDPLNKPIDDASETDFRDDRAKYKQEKDYGNLRKIMKRIRACDLRFVDRADAIIVNYDINIPMCGTFEEIFLANRSRKPIIIMCPQGIDKINDWMFGALPYELFFDSWDKVKEYLNSINNNDKVDTVGERWLFFTR